MDKFKLNVERKDIPNECCRPAEVTLKITERGFYLLDEKDKVIVDAYAFNWDGKIRIFKHPGTNAYFKDLSSDSVWATYELQSK